MGEKLPSCTHPRQLSCALGGEQGGEADGSRSGGHGKRNALDAVCLHPCVNRMLHMLLSSPAHGNAKGFRLQPKVAHIHCTLQSVFFFSSAVHNYQASARACYIDGMLQTLLDSPAGSNDQASAKGCLVLLHSVKSSSPQPCSDRCTGLN